VPFGDIRLPDRHTAAFKIESRKSAYRIYFFNLPIHYWLSGQFMPLWFILVGVAFNLWMDHNEKRHMEAIRYRARGRRKGEME